MSKMSGRLADLSPILVGNSQQSNSVGLEKLQVSLFGGVSLSYAGKPIAINNRKAKALIGYLVLTPNQSAKREHLVGLFWSESNEEKARASLRQVIRTLRVSFEQVGFQGFRSGRTDISIDDQCLELDVETVLNNLVDGRVHDLLLDHQRAAEMLQAGYDNIDPAHRNWLLVQRESLATKLTRALEALVQEGMTTPTATTAANALLLLDPTHEGHVGT